MIIKKENEKEEQNDPGHKFKSNKTFKTNKCGFPTAIVAATPT